MTYRINFKQYANHFALPQEIVNDDLANLDALYLKTALLIFKNADKHYKMCIRDRNWERSMEKAVPKLFFVGISKMVML